MMNRTWALRGEYFRSGRLPIFLFTLFYISAFSIGFIVGGNYEFAIYTVVMTGVLLLVTLIVRDLEIPNALLWALSGAGILHMLGGGVHMNGDRLYGLILLPIYSSATDPGLAIFRYDQFVHLLGYGVIAVCIHYAIRRTCPDADAISRAFVTILVVMGIGSFNEVVEFFATLTLSSTGVGDYSNTLLDLTFNTIGAIVAVSGYEWRARLKKKS